MELYSENAVNAVTIDIILRKKSDKATVKYIYGVRNYLLQ